MTQIEIKGKPFMAPTSWNDLSFKQLVAVIRILYGNYELELGKMKLLKILAGITDLQWACLKLADISDLLYLPEFLLKESKLTRQLVPIQDHLAGPADNFTNLVMAEFVFSEDHFFKYKEDESPEHLNNLVAVLFRPIKKGYDLKKNLDGDARIPFNENLCLYNSQHKIKKWDPALKLAILTWYEACRIQLVQDFPAVFAGGSGDPAKYGLLSMMRNVAAGGVHGDFKNVESMFVRMVMIELDEMLNEADQIEKLKVKK